MQDKVEGYKSVLLMKHSLFVVFTIIVISLTSSSCPTHPVYMDARLDGPLNIVPDSFYMEPRNIGLPVSILILVMK